MSLAALFLTGIFLSVVSGMSGGASSGNQGLVFFVGLSVLVPVGIGVGFFASFRQEKRAKLFEAAARQQGWTYKGDDNYNIVFPNWNLYRLFTLGNGDLSGYINSIAFKRFENGDVFVLDYFYNAVPGKLPVEGKTTAVAFQSNDFQLPYFSLYKEGFFSSVGELFGYKDIDFPSHPNFSSRYKLTGKDEAAIRQMFSPPVLDFLERMPDMCVDCGGSLIIIYTLKELAALENLDYFASEKLKVLNAFRQPWGR